MAVQQQRAGSAALQVNPGHTSTLLCTLDMLTRSIHTCLRRCWGRAACQPRAWCSLKPRCGSRPKLSR